MIEESPYFPSSSIDVGTVALERLAGKSLWPPIIWFSCYDLVRALEQVCLFLYLPEPHDMAKDSEAVYSQKSSSYPAAGYLDTLSQVRHGAAYGTTKNLFSKEFVW
ncbi:hypothetical protein AgCh_018103 [Apium graveolens]